MPGILVIEEINYMLDATMQVTNGRRQLNEELTQNKLLVMFQEAYEKYTRWTAHRYKNGWKCDGTPRRKKK